MQWIRHAATLVIVFATNGSPVPAQTAVTDTVTGQHHNRECLGTANSFYGRRNPTLQCKMAVNSSHNRMLASCSYALPASGTILRHWS